MWKIGKYTSFLQKIYLYKFSRKYRLEEGSYNSILQEFTIHNISTLKKSESKNRCFRIKYIYNEFIIYLAFLDQSKLFLSLDGDLLSESVSLGKLVNFCSEVCSREFSVPDVSLCKKLANFLLSCLSCSFYLFSFWF